MPNYLITATHPVDLGTGAFGAPQQQVTLELNDTIAEHLDSGRIVELPKPKGRSAAKKEDDA